MLWVRKLWAALALLNFNLLKWSETFNFNFPSPPTMRLEMLQGPTGVKGFWAFFSTHWMLQTNFDFLKLDDLMVLNFQGPPRLLLRINLQQFILPEAIFTPWNLPLHRVQKMISFQLYLELALFLPSPNVSISCGNQILSFNQVLTKNLAATKLGHSHSKLQAKLWKLFMPVFKATQTTVILPRN